MEVDHRILKAARVALGWNQAEMAQRAGIGMQTVMRIERGDPSIWATRHAMRRALSQAGVKLSAKGMELP